MMSSWLADVLFFQLFGQDAFTCDRYPAEEEADEAVDDFYAGGGAESGVGDVGHYPKVAAGSDEHCGNEVNPWYFFQVKDDEDNDKHGYGDGQEWHCREQIGDEDDANGECDADDVADGGADASFSGAA